jgi:hypothetical protein
MTLPLPLPPRCTDCDYCEPPSSVDVVVVVCCYHAPKRTERPRHALRPTDCPLELHGVRL